MAEKSNHMPFRIQAAKDFLCLCAVNEGAFSDVATNRELSEQEEKVKASALSCLQSYFTGEIDYGDCSPNQHKEEVSVSDKAYDMLKDMKKFIEQVEKTRKPEEKEN